MHLLNMSSNQGFNEKGNQDMDTDSRCDALYIVDGCKWMNSNDDKHGNPIICEKRCEWYTLTSSSCTPWKWQSEFPFINTMESKSVMLQKEKQCENCKGTKSSRWCRGANEMVLCERWYETA